MNANSKAIIKVSHVGNVMCLVFTVDESVMSKERRFLNPQIFFPEVFISLAFWKSAEFLRRSWKSLHKNQQTFLQKYWNFLEKSSNVMLRRSDSSTKIVKFSCKNH